jgi:hypothetical protein
LLLALLTVPAGIWAGRAIGRALRKPRDEEPETSREDGRGQEKIAVRAGTLESGSNEADETLGGFPCHLGDVILAHPDEEAWLAGALVFREGLPMAVLFIAPDAGGGRAIYARPAPESSLVWMAPLPPGSLAIGAEPPSSIEHEQERFERVRRLPYRVARIGTGAPDVGDQVIVAEYSAAAGDRILVVIGGGRAHAWRGQRLEPGMYDVLPSGKATLE